MKGKENSRDVIVFQLDWNQPCDFCWFGWAQREGGAAFWSLLQRDWRWTCGQIVLAWCGCVCFVDNRFLCECNPQRKTYYYSTRLYYLFPPCAVPCPASRGFHIFINLPSLECFGERVQLGSCRRRSQRLPALPDVSPCCPNTSHATTPPRDT